jgi:hypothetical protein
MFEQNISKNETGNESTKITTNLTNGLLQLRQGTQLISSGIGVSRRQLKVNGPGEDPSPNIIDTFSANLGLQPEGLPQANALFNRTHTYDKDRSVQDRINDFWSMSLRYEPVRDLALWGAVSLTEEDDKLRDINIKRWDYSGRATYSRRFWDRVAANASYMFSRTDREVNAGGAGEVVLQVFPFSGLSALSDTPELVTLDFNPALVDGDLTASSGINIGVPPLGGDTRKINIGVDFVNPPEVNLIYVVVSKDLPVSISNSYSWDIYISSDNLNWTLRQTVPVAPFSVTFKRFEISINTVSARYLKVVTKPLSPAVPVPPGTDASNIFVTELQTYLRSPVENVETKQTTTTHIYDLNIRWRILDRPTISYDFNYWGSRSDPGISQYALANALNVSHRFNRVFSGSARIGREDSEVGTDKRSANTISAIISAVPLPTLYHSLVMTGRFEEGSQGSDTKSAFLNNRAELYQGVNVNLSGGISISTDAEGRRNESRILYSGASVEPNPALHFSLNYSLTKSESTGGRQEDSESDTSITSLSASYTPFHYAHLYASYGVAEQTDRDTTTVQNYSVNWSPYRMVILSSISSILKVSPRLTTRRKEHLSGPDMGHET